MFDKITKSLKSIINKNKSDKEDSKDDDLFKELGIDDDSLLSGDDSATDPDMFLEDNEDMKRKEKSLLNMSYLVLAVSLVISIAGSAVFIMSNDNQEKILAQIEEDKALLSAEIAKVRESISSEESDNLTKKVEPIEFYTSLFMERVLVSDFVDDLFDFINDIRQEKNILIKPIKYHIDTQNKQFSFEGETNSYTNFAKFVLSVNESELMSDAILSGAEKTISADGIPTVPIKVQGKIVKKMEKGTGADSTSNV